METGTHATGTTADHPGVVAHPPFLYLGTLIGGELLDRIVGWTNCIPTWARVMGVVLFLCAFALAIWGRLTMTRAGTNVNPKLPATRLVVTGPFRWSRNPLYVALTLAYVGLALALDILGALALAVPLLAVVRYGVIGREERYLEAKFGEAYTRYKSVTRRWV